MQVEKPAIGNDSYSVNKLFVKMFALYTIKDQLAPLFPRPPQEEFEMLLLLAHYHAARAAFDGSPQLQEMSAKLSVALLG